MHLWSRYHPICLLPFTAKQKLVSKSLPHLSFSLWSTPMRLLFSAFCQNNSHKGYFFHSDSFNCLFLVFISLHFSVAFGIDGYSFYSDTLLHCLLRPYTPRFLFTFSCLFIIVSSKESLNEGYCLIQLYSQHLKQNLAHNTISPRIEITASDGKFSEDNESSAFKVDLKKWVGFHQIFYFEAWSKLSQRKKH